MTGLRMSARQQVNQFCESVHHAICRGYPEDRAILICVALAPTPVDRWRARIAGQEVSVSHSIAFATTVIDLMKPMEMWAAGPFDYLHYYVSRDLLDRVAADNRIAPSRFISDGLL